MRKRITLMLIGLASLSFCIGIAYELHVVRETGLQQFNRLPSFVNDTNGSTEYEIDPKTILMSLEKGEQEIFNPIIATPEVYTPLVAGSFLWTQSDYLKIASALGQIKWKEDLNDWYLFGMYFEKECGDNPKGFDSGSIIYFKAYNNGEITDYLHYQTETIAIYPLFKNVVLGGDYIPRPLFGWTSISLNSLKVTADNALQIAEENGGREARLKVKNVCNIAIFTSPNLYGKNNWEVRYSPASFDIYIDSYSGKYKVIDTNK